MDFSFGQTIERDLAELSQMDEAMKFLITTDEGNVYKVELRAQKNII